MIELVVVIAIIGILALVAVPRFGSITDGAEQRTVEANHRILISAAQMYYAENLEWPDPKLEKLSDFINKDEFKYDFAAGHSLEENSGDDGIIIQSWWGADEYKENKVEKDWEWNSAE